MRCRSADSVLKQSYRNWECIVVDDGSTDCTREVVLRYCSRDRRFRYLRQDNSGLSAARNTGIANSSGAYLQFLDSDDLIEPRKLECQVDYLERNPEIGIVYDHVWYFDSNNPCARRRTRTGSESNDRYPPVVQGSWNEVLLLLVENSLIMPLAPLSRRSVIEFIGYFDTSLNSSEDWDYWLRCAAKGVRFQHCEFADARGCVSYHPGSMCTNHLRMAHTKLQVRKKIATLTEDRAILDLNRMHWSYDEGRYGVELITQGHVLLGELRLMHAAITSFKFKHMIWWSACALLALFVRGSWFRAIALSSWNRAIAALLGQ
jgi:Glycosyl transferase family 2